MNVQIQTLNSHTSEMLDAVAGFGDVFLDAVVSLLPPVAAGIVMRAVERDADNTKELPILRLIAHEAERTLREVMRDGFEKNAHVMQRARECAGFVEAFIGRSQATLLQFRSQ